MRTMADFGFFGRTLKFLWVDKIEIDANSDDLSKILAENDKLVIAVNHGPTFGPLACWPAISACFEHAGGQGRVPIAVIWKKFYDMPVMKNFARFITQLENAVPLQGYADLLKDGPYNDFFVAPEGDNCNFGNGFDIQPFVSNGFIEIAVRANAPVLVAVHQGSEDWAVNLPVNDKVKSLVNKLPLPNRYQERLDETGVFSVTNVFKGKLDNCKMSFKLYQPSLKLEDLSEDKAVKKQQLAEEAERIRVLMQETIEAMKPNYIEFAKAA